MEQTTDTAGTVAAPEPLAARVPAGVRIDLWLAYVLLAAAVGLVLLVGIRHALDQPIYGPIDEAFHAGYVQKVADTGKPPMLGRDQIVLAHHTFKQFQVLLPGPEAGTAALPFDPVYFTLEQQEAIQPPLYYYVVAPVVWFTRGADKIYALRIASCVLEVIGVILLFAMIRRTLPRHPLAAGIAAVVLGSFTGITQLLSQVQNDSLLLPVCVLLLWAFVHDLEKGRVSPWHGLAAGAAAATQLVAAPIGAVTMLTVALYGARGFPRGAELRRLWLPLVLYVGPLGLWVALNLTRYGAVFPVGVGAPGQPPAHSTAGELFSRTFQLLHTAESIIVDSSYVPMWPAGPTDGRPMGLLMVVGFVALGLLLWRQLPESRVIGLWIGLAVTTFLIVFLATMANAARAGSTGEISSIFEGRYFVATLAAISGTVGISVSASLAGFDNVRRLASVAMCGGLIYFSLTASSII